MDKLTVEEQLKMLILQQYKSVRAFSIAHDIPYSTIDNIFKRGVGNIGITTAIKICQILSIDVTALGNGIIKPSIPTRELTSPPPKPVEEVTTDAMELAHAYDKAETLYEKNMARMALHLPPKEEKRPKLRPRQSDMELSEELVKLDRQFIENSGVLKCKNSN